MTWIVDEAALSVCEPDVLSSLFCVGNGASSTRGTLAEERHRAFRGVYQAGLYTRAGWGLVYLLGSPDWLRLQVVAGEVALVPIASRRELDLAAGVLRRRAEWRSDGVHLSTVEERFSSFADAGLMGQRLRVEVYELTVQAEIRAGIDGRVHNHQAKYYRPGDMPNSTDHGLRLSRVERLEAGGAGLTVVLRSRQTDRRALALGRVAQSEGPACPAVWTASDDEAQGRFRLDPALPGGATLRFDKLVALDGDFHHEDDGFDRAARLLAEAGDYGRAAERHAAAMAAFWKLADVEIDGDPEAQLAVRYAVWATRIAAPLDGGRSSMGARNLTGDWYRGAVFWDMETFQLPLLAAVAPDRARNHILYRFRRLPAARRLAAQDGYAGARFPWQSYASGEEEPPILGGFLYQQQHVTLAVARGVLLYHACTGDDRLLLEQGLELLVECASFFTSRVERDADGSWHLRGVTGPDEDHQGVDDNAYTNRLCAWVLDQTLDLVERLRATAPEVVGRICAGTGFEAEQRERCRAAAAGLYLPVLADGATLAQFAGFAAVPEPDETLCGAQGQRPDKPSKQADVLLLWQILPEAMDPAALERHWRQYAPLCNQASSLSFCTHALLAARLGRERDALRFYRSTIGIDLADSLGNTRHGIHGAAEGGIWTSTVQGFGGLHLGTDGLRIEPRLPHAWQGLRYGVLYRGCRLAVAVTPEEVAVVNHGERPVAFVCCGRPVVLGAGERLASSRRPAWVGQDLEAVVFDLDGVLVTTDDCHYRAWAELAVELGLNFDREVNHQLRGVSRQGSLKRIYAHNDRSPPAADEFERQCAHKNERYRELIGAMGPDDVLPGARELLAALRAAGIRTAVASASRNAPLVLARTGLGEMIDVVADGNGVTASKPDPQVFHLAAQRLRCLPWNCLGVEDAASGVEAIHRAGMVAIGIGPGGAAAEVQVDGVAELDVAALRRAFAEHDNPANPYLERGLSRTAEDQQTRYSSTLASSAVKAGG